MHLDVRVVLHLQLETLLALVSGGHAGFNVGDVDLALVADRLGERARRHAAAKHVVRRDIADRKVDVARAGLKHPVADKGIDAYDGDPGVVGFTQRLDELDLIGRRNQNRARFFADDRVENRNLERHVPFRSALVEKIRSDRLRRSFRAAVHGDVETV